MGKHATLQVRVEDAMKAEAEQLFEALGLSLSEAVRLFIAESVNGRRLPFTPQQERGSHERLRQAASLRQSDPVERRARRMAEGAGRIRRRAAEKHASGTFPRYRHRGQNRPAALFARQRSAPCR